MYGTMSKNRIYNQTSRPTNALVPSSSTRRRSYHKTINAVACSPAPQNKAAGKALTVVPTPNLSWKVAARAYQTLGQTRSHQHSKVA